MGVREGEGEGEGGWVMGGWGGGTRWVGGRGRERGRGRDLMIEPLDIFFKIGRAHV